ncbi:hypothetical protein ACIQC7_34700 [Kitasatospora sp. NPDC088556]|uniref:hypothetical protein n=1 Tax=Kitasatospora sp. NPDC088556 TaxID=3364076 RepID=UPI00382B385E
MFDALASAAPVRSPAPVGGWLPYPDPLPHAALGNAPIAYVAGGLWVGLRAMLLGLDPAAAEHDATEAACDLLRLLALTAVPVLGGGFATLPVAELDHRPLLFRPDGLHRLIASQ